jgi:predicted nucleic-acid-binding Zn-ribbon protein
MPEPTNYRCLRCHHTQCSIGELHAAGGTWSKIFDIEGRKFTTVTCERCRHTEFFQADRNTLASIFDLFVT